MLVMEDTTDYTYTADLFREELAKLLEKYDAVLEVDIEETHIGVQSVRLLFDLGTNTGWTLVDGCQFRDIDAKDIRKQITK